MIKKNSETGKESHFKKFSDMNNSGPKKTTKETSLESLPEEEKDIPGNPNLPVQSEKKPKGASTRGMKPLSKEQNYDKEESGDSINLEEVKEDHKVKLYGKIAKLPKGTKASKGYNFLENVKISKNSIWYIMVEKCENELQMVKYNHKKGVDLSRFVEDLKNYYSHKYQNNQKVLKLIESIEIDGNDKYSWIKNIPLIEVDGKKMISKITEDLIKLLSK